ncbi:hypothetical protein FQA39_LY16391 [Lamprigera yunnana]|nr:hypothetical protein FQA39_LY16391 [Lamprigera yunnana]
MKNIRSPGPGSILVELLKCGIPPLIKRKVTNQFQNLADEHITLKTRTRKLESQYTTERLFFESEIERLKSTNEKLEDELQSRTNKIIILKQLAENLQFENETLKNEVGMNSEKVSCFIQQNKNVNIENTVLKQDVEKLRKEIIINNEQLTRERREFQIERAKWNNMIKERSDNSEGKTRTDVYENVLKQNVVLKDLVKQMKYDKENFNFNRDVAEERIKELEGLVDCLRKRAN